MYKLCRHIRTSGGRCRAAALANESYCYYHLTQRRLSITLDLPPLEDRHSIQVAVSRVLTSLAAGLLDRRDAGMYLYGIQIASSNLASERGCLTPYEPVRRAVLTRKGDEVAEAKTIFEEQDLSGHKNGCTCEDCIYTETDDPHHPECRCGECHCFTVEEEPTASNPEPIPAESAPFTLHATAEASCRQSEPKEKNPCHRLGRHERQVPHPFGTKGWQSNTLPNRCHP